MKNEERREMWLVSYLGPPMITVWNKEMKAKKKEEKKKKRVEVARALNNGV